MTPFSKPFSKLTDLDQISGIGNVTAETMEPYLKFPQPDTMRP
jgi:hypothetical protein